jgi:hypothetical protein
MSILEINLSDPKYLAAERIPTWSAPNLERETIGTTETIGITGTVLVPISTLNGLNDLNNSRAIPAL